MSDQSDENNPAMPNSAAARKKEEKARKKDPRSLENIMKSMGDISDSEKLKILMEKYNELYIDFRKLTLKHQAMEKNFISVQKDRDVARYDLNKYILGKAKLESLCRELQKQNKAIKDENITRVKEEEEKRREVATNFTERLNSLSSMMDENKDKSIRLREENMNMTLKLTELYNKFQERESHLADVNRQLDTQKDLFESKIRKMELEYKADRKAWEEESKALLSNLLKSNETNRLLEENIKSMQTNLDVYKNQYSDFEQTMSRSNEVFKTFHGEINKLQKSNTALEKEKGEYVAKWQSCHNLILEISERNQELSKKLKMSEKKVGTLEKLCRQLQAERTTLHKQIHDKIEPLVSSQQQPDSNQIPSVNYNPAMQHSAQEKLLNPDKPKELVNGDVQSVDSSARKNPQGNQGDGQISSTVSDSILEIHNLFESSGPPILELAQTEQHLIDVLGSSQADPPVLNQQAMEYSSSDIDYVTDVHPLSSSDSSDASDDKEDSIIDLDTSESEVSVKEARSVPITDEERERLLDSNFEEYQSSSNSTDLCGDMSLETLPLYKPEAVTDISSLGGHSILVKESEARTNIREVDVHAEHDSFDSAVAGPSRASTSSISPGTSVKVSVSKSGIKKAKKK